MLRRTSSLPHDLSTTTNISLKRKKFSNSSSQVCIFSQNQERELIITHQDLTALLLRKFSACTSVENAFSQLSFRYRWKRSNWRWIGTRSLDCGQTSTAKMLLEMGKIAEVMAWSYITSRSSILISPNFTKKLSMLKIDGFGKLLYFY